MKVPLKKGGKIYLCDRCFKEVYSLMCGRVNGKNYDVCVECYAQERGE
jgi:hypothetical protein